MLILTRLSLHEAVEGHHAGQWVGAVDQALRCLILQHITELVLWDEHRHVVCAMEQLVGLHGGWLTDATHNTVPAQRYM